MVVCNLACMCHDIIIVCIANTAIDHAKCMVYTPINSYQVLIIFSYIGLPIYDFSPNKMQYCCLILCMIKAY